MKELSTFRYWVGILLVGTLSTLFLPLYAVLIGGIRIVTLVVDVAVFPYKCMTSYHEQFERQKSLSEALKKIAEDLESNKNN